MQTTDLIERLATDLRPTPHRAKWLAVAIFGGAVLALLLLWAFFGLRPDLAGAVLTSAFWMKWGFALAIATAAFFLCARLARPEGKAGWWPIGLLLPILTLGVVACVEMMAAPQAERQMMWLGHTAVQCMWCIPLLAAPLLIAILWAFRFFAPTRPRLAGFSAGLLAGAAAAVLYALHCDETALAFVATWYSAGMLFPALLGFLIGPRVLRW
jgi:hypothetical protein